MTASLPPAARRRLLLALPVVLAPLLLWGAVRLSAPERRARDAASPGAAEGAVPVSTAPVRSPVDAIEPPPDLPADVAAMLRQGRNWRAARRLRDLVRANPDPELALVAARAEAGWGGWSGVRELLEGKPWLDTAGRGAGWYLLGRAREEAGQWPAAADAYGRYLRATPEGAGASERVIAEVRHALALLRAGQVDAGAGALARVRERAPEIAGWTGVLAAEAVAPRGDTARVRALLGDAGPAAAPGRAQRAHVAAYRAANDPRGARAAALAHLRRPGGLPDDRAELYAGAGRAALDVGDTAAARRELRAALDTAPQVAAAVDAARALSALPGLSPADRLAVGTVYEKHGNAARAAEGFRAWLAAGLGTPEERTALRLRMGRLLFTAGRHAEAEEALRPLLAGTPPAVAAEAQLHIGRAQYRRGSRAPAIATLIGTADRYPGQAAAGEALFLAADLLEDGDPTRANALYRRAATELAATRGGGMALMRLAGAAFAARDYAGAVRHYEQYRASQPWGDLWLQASYWAGRAHLARGDAQAARERWREVRTREPLSYYAVKSAERLGERYWPIALNPGPAADGDATARVAAWSRTVDLLRAAGLQTEADAEVARRIAESEGKPALLYPLAEALVDRGYPHRAIRIALALRAAGAPYDARLVRILYPFPYREVVSAEARERGLDPFLVAALIRQESSFMARAQSRAGAMGLMQVMPATGAGLAAGAGIRGWERDLLFNPEINVHLGTRFLAAQVRSYGGDLPNVFIAYNAGPGRVARWRNLPEARDRELFTERIPFEETRDYVKILTRNTAIYRGLYGGN